MDIDWARAEEMALTLMFLTSFDERGVTRTWKGYDWELLRRLHEKGYISNPVGKAKSVVLTDEGRALSEELFRKHLGMGSREHS